MHRMHGSRDFHRASEQVIDALKRYGYTDASRRSPRRGTTSTA
ncbi:MAG: hypothetical protein ABIT01_01275 [Thermoanaerobaculia bacterium]